MHFDSLIVGCGTAGSVLASRLTEDPTHQVLAIEAGRDYTSVADLPDPVRMHRSARVIDISPELNNNDPSIVGFPDWGLLARSTIRQPEVLLPRGKVVGGSSSVNGCVFFRGLRDDFDDWVAAGNPSWSFDACLPYFVALEHDYDFSGPFHGTSGPIPVHRPPKDEWAPISRAFYEACLELGYPDCPDFNAPDSWGVGPIPVNIHERTRVGAAIGYLMPVHDRPNLTVLGETAALRLIIADGRATGLEVVREGRVERIEADEIYLTAGAVGSPHLLSHSGIGPARHLRGLGIEVVADLPGVGRNLRDHPVLCSSFVATSPVVKPVSSIGTTGQVGLRATTPGSNDPNDMRLMTYRSEGEDRFGVAFSLMHAASAGTLAIVDGDPTVAPRVDFAHLDDPSDRERMRSMTRLIAEIVAREPFRGIAGDPLVPTRGEIASDEALDEWMLQTVITGHHISGTCKMGPATDESAVVDETGRVHGVDGLHVVDASIMVDCPRVNINATTMMLAEKIAAAVTSRTPLGVA